MALNPLKIDWLEQLYKKNVFENKVTLLDLGPQDLTTSREYIYKTVSKRYDVQTLNNLLNQIYDKKGNPNKGFQKYFYSLWGIEEYYALDLNDDRADYRFDLNQRYHPKTFDVVTNFGTAEHIFNIGMFFENLHHLLSKNGIALNITPAFADINHGFYNIHPNVYSQLIRTNGYMQHSLVYLDNYHGKNAFLAKTLESYDFENSKINLGMLEDNFGDMSHLGTFREKVYRIFSDHVNKKALLENSHNPERGCFDYVFTAFEKINDIPFKIPQQYTTNVELLSN